jgi:hypothetical protein
MDPRANARGFFLGRYNKRASDPMPASAKEPIVIVSGLPRTGTSLMMQLLHAGGVPVLSDSHRAPDVSNPRGYFEYEKVKSLPADSSWLAEACGKALKVIAQLVPFLPRGFEYQVIFMQRDMDEVIQSQSTMIEKLGKLPAADPHVLALAFERNLGAAREFISHQPQTTTEYVDYHELVTSPDTLIERLIRFLRRPDLDRRAMIDAVDMQLYRSRRIATDTGQLPKNNQ